MIIGFLLNMQEIFPHTNIIKNSLDLTTKSSICV